MLQKLLISTKHTLRMGVGTKHFAFKDADKYIVNDNIKKLNWLKNRK